MHVVASPSERFLDVLHRVDTTCLNELELILKY